MLRVGNNFMDYKKTRYLSYASSEVHKIIMRVLYRCHIGRRTTYDNLR